MFDDETPIEDGGAAWPIVVPKDWELVDTGASLRDYFAASAPSMDAADMCSVMGWESDLPLGDGEEDEWQDSIVKRWKTTPMAERLEAETRFNFMYADAMLAARKAKS